MRTAFIAIIASLFFIACSDDSSSPVTPAPVMTGKWDMNMVILPTNEQVNGIIDLTESDGALSGTITIFTSTRSVSGSISQNGAVTLGHISSGLSVTVTGNANTSRDQFSGTWSMSNGSEIISGTHNSTRRK